MSCERVEHGHDYKNRSHMVVSDTFCEIHYIAVLQPLRGAPNIHETKLIGSYSKWT